MRPSFSYNLPFTRIRGDKAAWLEREFEEDEVRAVVFDLGSDKVLGLDGFLVAFSQRFSDVVKEDIMPFMREFIQM